MNFQDKENLPIPSLRRAPTKLITNLKTINNLRDSLSPVNNSSLSSRMKRRSQVLKALDFNLQKRMIPMCKNVKADHSISLSPVKISKTARKPQNKPVLVLNNRIISKNIIFDAFPCNQ